MVERGGLDYPIRVRDEFSKTTALFRKEIRAAKKELREFQKVARGGKSGAAGARENAKRTREGAKAQRESNKANKEGVKPLSDLERFEKKRQRTLQNLRDQVRLLGDEEVRTARLQKQAAADSERASRNAAKTKEREAKAARKLADSQNVELQARKANERAAFREAVQLERVAQLKRQGRAQIASGNVRQGLETLKNAKGLEKSLTRQLGTAQKLLFTFRRLVGALAIFTLARRGVQVFNDLVKSGIQFNDTVATAQLGIAGLVVTLADVRDAQGQSVDNVQELNLALGVAREQTAKLRQDSLKTVATFEQLLDTFQVSVGPGLAAGLNLDEVRQLTVDISQAASALGVPQNQLAEEVRSLLSGTIQARTTRIATALGISNEDVRRLKETGELFDFLEEKFAGFAEAAERQARTTFTGITTLIKGLFQEILGDAAAPLFEELISLGNDLFDNFLSIRDAAGNIKPDPDVVAAFQQIFDAIKRSVEAFRELGQGSAIDTLDTVLAVIAGTIDFITGALVQMVSIFASVSGAAQEFAEFVGLTSEGAGQTLQFLGRWLVNLIAIKKIFSFLSVRMLKIVGLAGAWVAAFVIIGKGLEFILEKIFGLNLNLKDTIELVSLGLLEAWFEFTGAIQTAAQNISNFFGSAIDAIVAKTKSGALRARAAVNEFFFDDEEAQELKDRAFVIEQAARKEAAARVARNKVELQDIKDQTAAKLQAVQDEIAAVVAARAGENAQGEGFDPNFDPGKAARDAEEAARSFVSTANRPVAELGEALGKVNDEIVKAGDALAQAEQQAAGGFAGIGGIAGGVNAAFAKEELAVKERLRKIEGDLLQNLEAQARLRAAGVGEDEGALVSAKRDELLLTNAIANAEEQSLTLASLKAQTLITQALPAIRDETAALGAQAAAERAKTAAVVSGLGSRQMALVAAQSATQLATDELVLLREKNRLELQSLANRALVTTDQKELEALLEIIDALEVRQQFEEEILELRRQQLAAAEEEAELVANGTLSDGLKRGFEDLAESYSSQFQAGIDIATTALNGFTQFASQAIVDAFDPTKDSGTIKENFARLLQQISQVILQKLIQLAIAKLLIEAGFGGGGEEGNKGVENATKIGAIQISTATSVAAIRLANATAIAALRVASGGAGFADGGQVPEVPPGGLARGGLVPSHFGPSAQGLARGGKPAHIPASDTVPAWLTPGEFVMNKASTSQFLPLLEGMNGGNMSVVGSSSAEAAGPSAGMQAGGLVADQIAGRSSEDRESEGGGAGVVVVPAVVARDSEMDTFTAGGKNALLAFMRDQAGNINSLLDRSNRQG